MAKRKVLLLGGCGFLGAQMQSCFKDDPENEIVATLDTSLDTSKARAFLQTTFRDV